jgi:hypothetical protein
MSDNLQGRQHGLCAHVLSSKLRLVGRHPPLHVPVFGQTFGTAPMQFSVAQSCKWAGWKFLLQRAVVAETPGCSG